MLPKIVLDLFESNFRLLFFLMLFGVRSFVYLLALFQKYFEPNKCFPLTLNSDVRDNFFFRPQYITNIDTPQCVLICVLTPSVTFGPTVEPKARVTRQSSASLLVAFQTRLV